MLAVEKVKAIHVYDFDNTLFKTPLPNPKLWNGQTIGMLANPNSFVNGGWWHDSRILSATGEGLAVEETRAWEGWWNEKVVELVKLSIEQQDALCVLLTGRAEVGFTDIIKRMVASKNLDFDLASLKPLVGPSNERFSSTMNFKQAFLRALMETYKQADEIRIYEDRVKHVKGFREFLAGYNMQQSGQVAAIPPTRGPISGEVVQVAETAINLDPVVEVAEIQHLINAHNNIVSQVPRGPGVKGDRLVIKKNVFFTGYLLEAPDTQRLLSLVQTPAGLPDGELKVHGNNIMICPRPCPKHILDKVGGMGSKMSWEVVGTGCFDNSIWAACLKPVPATAKFHTENPRPLVVLALRRGARPADSAKIQSWQPVPAEKAFVFETTVTERVMLRIEAEDATEGTYDGLFPNKATKRKHPGEEDSWPKGPSSQTGGQRNFHSGHVPRGGSHQGRFRGGHNAGGRGGFKGPRGGGQPKRGGRGGNHHYKSLDDMGPKENQGGVPSRGQLVSYDDLQMSYQPPTAPQAHNQGNRGQPQQMAAWQGGGNGSQQTGGAGRPAGGTGYGTGGPGLNNFY